MIGRLLTAICIELQKTMQIAVLLMPLQSKRRAVSVLGTGE
jgi:hypothetical protein